MCRMIAAVGRVELPLLRPALLSMADNCNPGYEHERRSLGKRYCHGDGWGAAWVENGELRHVRSPRSCLEDPEFSRLDGLRTSLLILHARRASEPGTVALANTHPFIEERDGHRYAFCHNGTVFDLGPLQPDDGWKPQGGIDSELLAHHVIRHLDREDPEGSVLASLEPIGDYSSLHSLLACVSWILAMTKRHPQKSRPGYHALWEARGDHLHLVSTEPFSGLPVGEWRRLDEPGVVRMTPEAG